VATQSVAVGLTSLPPHWPGGLVAVAVACWAVGVIGYLLVAGLVTAARLAFPVRPAALTPGYWVFMGARRSAYWPGRRSCGCHPAR
jgi:hypothetical protein